jgi:hypothetical protein
LARPLQKASDWGVDLFNMLRPSLIPSTGLGAIKRQRGMGQTAGLGMPLLPAMPPAPPQLTPAQSTGAIGRYDPNAPPAHRAGFMMLSPGPQKTGNWLNIFNPIGPGLVGPLATEKMAGERSSWGDAFGVLGLALGPHFFMLPRRSHLDRLGSNSRWGGFWGRQFDRAAPEVLPTWGSIGTAAVDGVRPAPAPAPVPAPAPAPAPQKMGNWLNIFNPIGPG